MRGMGAGGAGDRGRRFTQGKRRAREGVEEKREMALFRHGSDVRSTAPPSSSSSAPTPVSAPTKQSERKASLFCPHGTGEKHSPKTAPKVFGGGAGELFFKKVLPQKSLPKVFWRGVGRHFSKKPSPQKIPTKNLKTNVSHPKRGGERRASPPP